MQFDIQDGHNPCEWATFILMPRVRAMGMWGQRIRGVYKDSKHKTRGKWTAWTNNYMEKQGWGLMETNCGFRPQHRWGGCLDAHRVWVLAHNIEMGMDGQVHWSMIDGSQLVFGPGLSEFVWIAHGQVRLPEDAKGGPGVLWVKNVGNFQDWLVLPTGVLQDVTWIDNMGRSPMLGRCEGDIVMKPL